MQFLLGIVTALIIVIGAVCFFLKHNQLSILFVAQDKKSPIFLQSKDLKTSDFIQVQYAGIGALGTISNTSTFSTELLGTLLASKNKSSLESLIKSHFPDQFIASKINNTVVDLINIVIEARDSRRLSHIDDALEVIRTYIKDCQSYWVHKSIYPNTPFSPNYTNYLICRKLNWKSTDKDLLRNIYFNSYKPWHKDV